MTLDQVISSEPVKEKLRNLPQYLERRQLPSHSKGLTFDEDFYGSPEVYSEFGAYLASRLTTPEINPIAFVNEFLLALYHLDSGVDDATNQPIRNRLVKVPERVYRRIENSIPVIAEAICPPEFATAVKEYYEQVKTR